MLVKAPPGGCTTDRDLQPHPRVMEAVDWPDYRKPDSDNSLRGKNHPVSPQSSKSNEKNPIK